MTDGAGAQVTGWAARLGTPGGRDLTRLAADALGTGLLAATLLTTRTGRAWVWALLGAGFACWLVFVAAETRYPRAAMTALAGCTLLAAVASGTGEGQAMLYIGLIIFAASPVPRTRVITGLAAADMAVAAVSGALGGQSAANILLTIGGLLVVGLVGLTRRQHVVQARQTERLLEQTRRAQQEHARAAALDERTRIAREMHDVLAHSLGALGVQLEVAEALLDEDDPAARSRARDRVRRARRLAVDGLAEARRAVAALRDDVPSPPEALRELAEGFRRDHRAPIACRVVGTPRPLPPEAAVSLIRTAREALTNAARHAPGAAVTVVLAYRESTVALTVHNAAPAAPPESTASRGFGLTGMRERLALAGGTLSAGRVPPAPDRPARPGGPASETATGTAQVDTRIDTHVDRHVDTRVDMGTGMGTGWVVRAEVPG